MLDERESSQTYLLTLASRLPNVKMLVVLVEEANGEFSYHRAKFSEHGTWINVIGNMTALAHDIMAKQVVWTPCNQDGTDLEEDE